MLDLFEKQRYTYFRKYQKPANNFWEIKDFSVDEMGELEDALSGDEVMRLQSGLTCAQTML